VNYARVLLCIARSPEARPRDRRGEAGRRLPPDLFGEFPGVVLVAGAADLSSRI
jgi:hypothetical protein